MFSRFIIIYILLVPFIIHATVPVLTLIIRGSETKINSLSYFIGTAGLLLLLILSSAILFTTKTIAIIVTFFSTYLSFVAVYLFMVLTMD